MKNKNYLSDQIRNNIPKRNIEEGRESVRMFVEMLKKRKINVIDEAILNRAYEEEDYVDEKMLGLVLKALKIDEPVQYIPRYIRNMNAFHANGTKVVVVDELLEYTLISFLFTMYSLENNRSEENVTRCMKNFYVLEDLQNGKRESKTVPREKRVFKVDISGDERNIAAAIDKYLHPIKDKYGIVRNNQVAILCRSNSTAFKVGENLSTPYKIFEETVLDRDNSEWGRFFRDLISARFDEAVFAVDYAEQLFSEELEPQKYRKALALCQSIFSNSFEEFCNAEDKIKELAGLVYAQKETKVALNNLHSVISDPHQLKNYVPARENELNIMTLHKSKGLEFNIVFHMDMYKWIIPNEYGDESSVQQDLNLHYVGLTRAKDACYIMNGTARFRSKKNDYIFAEPSSFLSKPGLAERRKDVRWEM